MMGFYIIFSMNWFIYSVNRKLSLSLLREVLHEYQSSFAEMVILIFQITS